jgi:hypothetical protein
MLSPRSERFVCHCKVMEGLFVCLGVVKYLVIFQKEESGGVICGESSSILYFQLLEFDEENLS